MPLRSMLKVTFNLRHATGSRGDAGQLEAAKRFVVKRHGALALQHMDFHSGLGAVGRGGEHLRLRGDGGVAVNQAGKDGLRFQDPAIEGSRPAEAHP